MREQHTLLRLFVYKDRLVEVLVVGRVATSGKQETVLLLYDGCGCGGSQGERREDEVGIGLVL